MLRAYIITAESGYVGQWKDNEKSGQGTYTWPSGNKYVGQWHDDNRNGQGTFYYANGRVEAGLWKDDKIITVDSDSTQQSE